MVNSLYFPDGPDLIVTPDEFLAIKDLEFKCQCSETIWDDHQWVSGLRIILGGRMPKSYTKTKIIVDWSL